MPPKLCGRCSKTVYPTEELKCLDKVWHKGCFKCQSCNMTLNMKNYKGYDKLPYCNAHYPQTKHTAVADTPENRRIAKNTSLQSNLVYHAEFEANKDRYTQVCDTPEMRTVLRNSENISMIKYHEEFEKQKGKKITVADDPEVQRVRQNMQVISNVSYHGDKDKRYQQELARPAEQVEGQQGGYPGDRRSGEGGEEEGEDEAGRVRSNPGRISDFTPEEPSYPGTGGTPYSSRNSAGAKQVYDSNVGKGPSRALAYQAQRYYNEEPANGLSTADAHKRISRGSVQNRVQRFSSSGDDEAAQYRGPRSPGYQQAPRSSGYEQGPRSPGYEQGPRSSGYEQGPRSSGYEQGPRSSGYEQGPRSSGYEQGPRSPGQYGMEQPQARRVGSISDYDPVNENFGSIAGQYNQGRAQPQQQQQQQQPAYQPPPPQQQAYQPPPQQYQPPPPQAQQPPPPAQQPRDNFAGKGMVCQAMYDYDAADADEVSFRENDHLIFCQPIDEGWMEGTVEKTGERGMLPSNYVKKVM